MNPIEKIFSRKGRNSTLDFAAFLLLFELGLEKERREGDERADKDERSPFDGPFTLLHGEIEEDEKEGENDTVNHPGNSDRGLVAQDSFLIDREVKEDDE